MCATRGDATKSQPPWLINITFPAASIPPSSQASPILAMSDSESSSLYDISGFVFGLLGLLGTVQIFCIIIFYYFPKRRLHGLETTYAEAYFLYHCGVQERILDADMQRIEEKLRWYICPV